MSSENRNTPRSDEVPHNVGELAMFCRKLERELSALRKELDRHEGLEAEYAFALNDRMRERDALRKELEEAKEQLEIERMRLVACGVIAICDTAESAKQARDMHPDYMSGSCNDVARRVDECIDLRAKLAASESRNKELAAVLDTLTIIAEHCDGIEPLYQAAQKARAALKKGTE